MEAVGLAHTRSGFQPVGVGEELGTQWHPPLRRLVLHPSIWELSLLHPWYSAPCQGTASSVLMGLRAKLGLNQECKVDSLLKNQLL